MSEQPPQTVSEGQARIIAVYAISVIDTLLKTLNESGIVGVDQIATDIHRYLDEHGTIINKMCDGKTLKQAQLEAFNAKNNKVD